MLLCSNILDRGAGLKALIPQVCCCGQSTRSTLGYYYEELSAQSSCDEVAKFRSLSGPYVYIACEGTTAPVQSMLQKKDIQYPV